MSSGASPAEVLEKNRAIYDDATDAFWRLAVYEPVHGGWEFSNMGGRRLLDDLDRLAGLGPDREALELCSGLGANCRYLASRYACRVTGLEMNPNQVERARQRLGPDLAGRIEFLEQDVTSWQPGRSFDLVYAIDSLMLVADLPAVLRAASEALAPGGTLMLAEILAGPNVTPGVRRFAWEEDGMLNLPSAEEYRELLRAAGFAAVHLEDVTGLALDCQAKILGALAGRRADIVRLEGEEMYERCLHLTRTYQQAFEDRELVYQRITGQAGNLG